jgi:hypothetical protein
MRKTMLTFTLAALVVAPASAVAGDWKSVGPISTPGQGSTILSDGVDAQGVFTALFRDANIDDEIGPLQQRDRGPGGRLVGGSAFAVEGNTLPDLAVAPNGERIAAYLTGPEGSTRVEVRTSVPGGSWSAPQVLADNQQRVLNVEADVAPNGEAVVSWVDQRAVTATTIDAELRASERTSGASAFGPTQTIDRGNIYFGLDVELDAAGNALAVWTDRDARVARYAQRPAGGAFGAPRTMTVPGDPVVESRDVRLDVAPGGRSVFTWRIGPEGPAENGVAAAVGTTTGGFGPGRALSTQASGIGGDTDGDLTAITWVEKPGSQGRVKAILLRGDADLGGATVRTLSGRMVPYGFGEVAVARGRAAFVWVRRVAGPRVVEARTATADGRFTRTQTLSSRSDTASQLQITMSSRGEAWVAWNGQRRTDLRVDTTSSAKASSRTGVFSRAIPIARGPGGLDQLELLPSVGGTMLAAYRRGYWYLRAYGEH